MPDPAPCKHSCASNARVGTSFKHFAFFPCLQNSEWTNLARWLQFVAVELFLSPQEESYVGDCLKCCVFSLWELHHRYIGVCGEELDDLVSNYNGCCRDMVRNFEATTMQNALRWILERSLDACDRHLVRQAEMVGDGHPGRVVEAFLRLWLEKKFETNKREVSNSETLPCAFVGQTVSRVCHRINWSTLSVLFWTHPYTHTHTHTNTHTQHDAS